MHNPSVRLAYQRLKRGTGIHLRFAEDYILTPGFRRNLEKFYDKASPEDKARCLNLITSIDIGSAVQQEQATRRKSLKKRLLTEGPQHPQPPPPPTYQSPHIRPKSAYASLDPTSGTLKMGPYSTTYKREYVPRQDDPVPAHRPASTKPYSAGPDGPIGAVGETTYNDNYYSKPQRVVAPIRSEEWRNNPHPLEVPSHDSWTRLKRIKLKCCKETPRGIPCCKDSQNCCRRQLICKCCSTSVDCIQDSIERIDNCKTLKSDDIDLGQDSPNSPDKPSGKKKTKVTDKQNCRKVLFDGKNHSYDDGDKLTREDSLRGPLVPGIQLVYQRDPCDVRKTDPRKAFLHWRFPHQAQGEASASEWSRELTDDLMDAVCRGQLTSTYQNDYLGLPQGVKPKNLYASLDPGSTDWRGRVPYTFDTSTRRTYIQPDQQPEHQPNVLRYGCNPKKHISAVGAVPTVSKRAPQMHIRTRTTYENHYNDTAPYQHVETVRDVGRELNAASIRRFYNATDDPKEKQKLARMMKAMHIQTPTPPSSAAASIRRNMRFRPEATAFTAA